MEASKQYPSSSLAHDFGKHQKARPGCLPGEDAVADFSQQMVDRHERMIDTGYAATAILGLIHHAADSINVNDPCDTSGLIGVKLARDIRRSTELVEEMIVGLVDHLENTAP